MSNPHDTILIKNKQGQFKTVDLGNKDTAEPLIDAGNTDKKNRIEKKDKKEKKEWGKVNLKKDFSSLPPQSKIKKDNMPQPIASEVSAPSFYFNLEDEQEAEQFKNKEKVINQKEHKENLKQKAEEIIEQINLKLNDEHKKRLLSALESYLRGVRSIINLKEVLIRPENLGGVGLDNEQVDLVLDKLKVGVDKKLQKNVNTEDAQKIQKKNSASSVMPREEEKKDTENKNTGDPEKTQSTQKDSETSAISRKALDNKQEVQLPKQENVQDKKEKIEELKEEVKSEEGQPQTTQKTTPKSERKIFGPIEELANYDLNNFRNLAPTPQQALEKIKDKILLLQDESFEKRAQAIKAWRSSPVYKNYLTLGQESMEQGKSVKQIIYDYKEQNKPTLSFEEFEAVADFNEKIND